MDDPDPINVRAAARAASQSEEVHRSRHGRLSITFSSSAVALALLLGLSYIISRPLFLLTATALLGWLVLGNLGRRFRPLQQIAPVGALVLLTLAALLMAQLGVSRYWALILVWVLLIALLILQLAGTGLSPLRKVFPTSTLLIALVPFTTLALAAVLWPGMAFAWVMIGDGHPEFNLMTLYRELPAGDFFPRHYPFATTGHLLVADSLNITSSYTGIDAFRTDLQAMAAVTFLPIVLAVQQMQMAFGSRVQSGRSMLQGITLGIFACSGLVMGLPASNGFISTSLSVLFYSSLAVLISAIFKRFTVAALIGSALLVIALVSTWQPVAMTGLGLIIAALIYNALRSKRKSPAGIAAFSGAGVLVVFGFYELFSIVTSGASGFPGLHGNYYYPMTPLAIFLLMGVVAITTANSNRLRTTAIALSAAAIAGTLAFMFGNRFFDFFDVLAGTFIVSSTPYYYLFKYIWLVSVPVVILAGVAITNTLTTSQKRPSAVLLTSAFLVVPFIAVTTPNFPWIPKSSQPTIKALSEEFGTELKSKSATFYFNVRGDVEDEAVSNWWLLQHRRYELGIGGPEWVEARRPYGTAYPQWKEVREKLGSAALSGKVVCDEVALIASGMNVQDPINFPDGLFERCTQD